MISVQQSFSNRLLETAAHYQESRLHLAVKKELSRLLNLTDRIMAYGLWHYNWNVFSSTIYLFIYSAAKKECTIGLQ